ncbi:Hsp20/alpha crystallin family protein [Sutcliffiella rhizosphaerae]|uniref:SHSP domain-containing protein n=1 Tax=Sutcliffiella rhizosphaerae TaxID=2880967 RepID=A0ABM8YRG9_9BACI|nr:Hsp20/alpha crystallin family protein [Sutcliffiella rhizosphaerae]CAG9622605.1 hypothetical protein BACCIP111883_03396 [Sutcliffiella rhizosphaerae]
MTDEKGNLPQRRQPQNNIMSSIDSFFNRSPIKDMIKQMDNFFGNAFLDASFPVETYETSKDFIVLCKLPGIKKEQISIETFDRYLTIGIKNNQTIETIDEKDSSIHSTYAMNESKRTIPTPDYVKINSMKANYRDGLLQIRIPKKNSKQIEIND